jgi:hypothetical protein
MLYPAAIITKLLHFSISAKWLAALKAGRLCDHLYHIFAILMDLVTEWCNDIVADRASPWIHYRYQCIQDLVLISLEQFIHIFFSSCQSSV